MFLYVLEGRRKRERELYVRRLLISFMKPPHCLTVYSLT